MCIRCEFRRLSPSNKEQTTGSVFILLREILEKSKTSAEKMDTIETSIIFQKHYVTKFNKNLKNDSKKNLKTKNF